MKLEIQKMDEWFKELELVAIKKAAFDYIPYPVWIKKYNEERGVFVMVFINKAYTDFTGIEYENYVGKTDFDIHLENEAKEYHDDDMEVYLNGETIFKKEHFDGDEYDMAKTVYKLNGDKRGVIGIMMINKKIK